MLSRVLVRAGRSSIRPQLRSVVGLHRCVRGVCPCGRAFSASAASPAAKPAVDIDALLNDDKKFEEFVKQRVANLAAAAPKRKSEPFKWQSKQEPQIVALHSWAAKNNQEEAVYTYLEKMVASLDPKKMEKEHPDVVKALNQKRADELMAAYQAHLAKTRGPEWAKKTPEEKKAIAMEKLKAYSDHLDLTQEKYSEWDDEFYEEEEGKPRGPSKVKPVVERPKPGSIATPEGPAVRVNFDDVQPAFEKVKLKPPVLPPTLEEYKMGQVREFLAKNPPSPGVNKVLVSLGLVAPTLQDCENTVRQRVKDVQWAAHPLEKAEVLENVDAGAPDDGEQTPEEKVIQQSAQDKARAASMADWDFTQRMNEYKKKNPQKPIPKAAFETMFKESAQEEFKRATKAVNSRGLRVLANFTEGFRSAIDHSRNQVRVTVTTADKLSEQHLNWVKLAITPHLGGRTPIFSEKQDKSLTGGLKFEFDGSLGSFTFDKYMEEILEDETNGLFSLRYMKKLDQVLEEEEEDLMDPRIMRN